MSAQQLSLSDSSDSDIEALHALTAIYTRDHVVDDILDRVDWPSRPGRLLDPSCGDGAFVFAALKRLRTSPGDFDSVCRVQGWEIYNGAVFEAHNRVKSLLIERGWSASSATVAALRVVRKGDFLMQTFERGEFSTLVGNPPYLRFASLPDSFKGLYGGALPQYARADLLHAFLDRCCTILSDNGTVGFVTADRWLFNETAGRLREIVGRHVGVEYLHRLDSGSSFYRPKQRMTGTPPRIHPVSVILSTRNRSSHPITRLPISPDGRPTVSHQHTLSDIATIQLAPWLGPKGIFVIDVSTMSKLAGARVVRAVDTDDIDPVTDKIGKPRQYVIMTSPEQEPRGAVRKHLLQTLQSMPERGRKNKWWLPPESTQIDISKPSLLVPRIAKKLRVVHLPAGMLPINHNHQIVSSRNLQEIERILLSDESQKWIAENAARLEGGYLSITTRLLRRLPISE